MARFADTLASLAGMEETLPPTWSDDLSSAYDDDINEAVASVDSANAMIGQLQAENAALSAEVQRVKAHNYELMMQVGAPPEDESTDDGSDEDESDDSDDSDDAQRAIDELFV